MKEPTIRAATLDDAGAVLELLRLKHEEEAPFPGDFNPDVARESLMLCFHHGMVLASCNDTRIVGTAALLLQTPYWSHDPYLLLLWHYVHPRHRKGQHAKHLIRAARHAAAQVSKSLVCDVFSSNSQGKVALFRRAFGGDSGAVFIDAR